MLRGFLTGMLPSRALSLFRRAVRASAEIGRNDEVQTPPLARCRGDVVVFHSKSASGDYDQPRSASPLDGEHRVLPDADREWLPNSSRLQLVRYSRIPADGAVTGASSAVISGTPTAIGRFEFTVTASTLLESGSQAYTVVINPPPGITTASLASGRVNEPYSQSVGVAGGTSPYNFSVSAGRFLRA